MPKIESSRFASLSGFSEDDFIQWDEPLERVPAMSPPRRPRGEKPRTTIRYLHRQIANLENVILDLRTARSDKDKQIAKQDVELSEADTESQRLISRVADHAIMAGGLSEKMRAQSDRLNFLEGYYAKSQELLPHDPAKTIRGASAGDTRPPQNGALAQEEGRQEDIGEGLAREVGGEIPRFRPDYPAPHYWR